MSVMKEIEKLVNLSNMSINYRYINFGGNGIYVEGIKGVFEIEKDVVSFLLKKDRIIINGENLKVKYLDKSTCVITGKIKVVEVK